MASTINADNGVSSGSAGLKSTADSSGVLALQTNGTTAISIDASQAVSFTNQPTYSGGTANGVAYLNGSKVLTTGSALTFDGTNLGVGSASLSSASGRVDVTINGTSSSIVSFGTGGIRRGYMIHDGTDLTTANEQAAGALRFVTSAGESMRIATATGGVGAVGIGYSTLTSVGNNGLAVLGNVGIGTSSPSMKFEVSSTSVATARISSSQTSPNNILMTGGSSYNYGVIGVNTGNNTSTGDVFQLGYTSSAGAAPTSVLQWSSAAKCIGLNTTPATSGTGITFPATQSASTDANTLDDYEEGTWTPTFSVGGTTFTSRGWYIKVGVVCHIGFNNLEGVSAISDGATAIVTGLPFNIKQDSGTNNYKFGAGIACIFSDASDGYNNKPLAGRINPANPVGGQASAAKIDFRNISGVATTTSDPFSFGGSYITE